ncbi:unnamed protein product, partial [Ectocarpus sp. 8 AP-2014]
FYAHNQDKYRTSLHHNSALSRIPTSLATTSAPADRVIIYRPALAVGLRIRRKNSRRRWPSYDTSGRRRISLRPHATLSGRRSRTTYMPDKPHSTGPNCAHVFSSRNW